MSDLNEILCKMPVLKTGKIHFSLISDRQFLTPTQNHAKIIFQYIKLSCYFHVGLSSEATNYSATQEQFSVFITRNFINAIKTADKWHLF